jgi:hypothetical protein
MINHMLEHMWKRHANARRKTQVDHKIINTSTMINHKSQGKGQIQVPKRSLALLLSGTSIRKKETHWKPDEIQSKWPAGGHDAPNKSKE